MVAVASAAVLAVSGNEEPQDDSNFGVQIGMLKYLASYYEQYTPPFGIIAGKATMFRMVQAPYTRVSVSFGVGLSLEVCCPPPVAAPLFPAWTMPLRPCRGGRGPAPATVALTAEVAGEFLLPRVPAPARAYPSAAPPLVNFPS